MSWRLARSLVVLRREVDARWPGRDKSSDGSIGDPAHSARVSDHNPDSAGVVRAVDLDDNDERPEGEGIGRVIAETIRAAHDPRCKYAIYHARMFSSYPVKGVPAWTWRPYRGPNGHFRHLHVSVVADARADGEQPWGITAPPAPQEVDMKVIQQEQRGIAVIGAGYFAACSNAVEVGAAVETWGAPVIFNTPEKFDAARSLALRGLPPALAPTPAPDVDEEALAAALLRDVLRGAF